MGGMDRHGKSLVCVRLVYPAIFQAEQTEVILAPAIGMLLWLASLQLTKYGVIASLWAIPIMYFLNREAIQKLS